MNNRLSEKLRVVSFLLIMMVVYVHSYCISFKLGLIDSELKGYGSFFQYFISQGLARLPTPMFFGISGYLFFLNIKGTPNEFISKFKKRLKSLVVPYLLWSLWGLLFYFILQSLPESTIFFKKELVKDYSTSKLLNTLFLDPVPRQLWFLRDLIVLVILSPIIYLAVKYLKLIIVLFFLLMWFLNYDFVLLSNRALLFFTFGAFLSTKKEMLINFEFSKNSWIYIYLWVFIFLIKTVLVYSNYRNLFIIETLHKAGILLGMWAVWNLYDYLFAQKDWAITKYYKILPFSFFIYVFHEPFLTIIKKILFYITGKGEIYSLFIYLGAPILTIFISLVIAFSVNRISPNFFGIINGKR